MRVALSRIHFPVTTLGPGRRVGIWLQGCSIRCPGCISVDTWDGSTGYTQVGDVLNAVDGWADRADGLTVSGGEPFDQPDALAEVLHGWRRLSATSVLLFTGYDFDAIEPWLIRNPGLVDAIMTGPYRRDAGQSLALRGSDNQLLHVLSPLGGEFAAYDRARTAEDRRLDVMFDAEGGAWFAGIPEPDDFIRFRRVLAAAGHTTTTRESAP